MQFRVQCSPVQSSPVHNPAFVYYHFGSIVDPAADYPANSGQCALKPHEDCNRASPMPRVQLVRTYEMLIMRCVESLDPASN